MRPPRANAYRDAWCGELRAGDVGAQVRVAGWVHRRRDHGGLIFIDLRDRTGLVQLVFHPQTAAAAHALAERLRSEHVVSAAGTVVRREEGNVNPKLATGEIELEVAEAETLSESATPPFPVDEETPVDELLRLRYRVVDLRREGMQRSMVMRHTVNRAMRDYLNAHDFLEIETPIMTRSTPEGARDFLVPSRMNPGDFYALPQSPQLFKQMLMMAGFERYFQIARCFRDEDLRADRQPEFTQLDLEMSFVEEDDVIETIEGMMARVYEATGFQVAPPPWPRMSYDEAVRRYGIDRPDVRFGLEISDLGDALAGTEFRVFASVLAAGGVVRGLNAGERELSRKDLDGLTEFVRGLGAGGLVWAFVEEDGSWRSPAAARCPTPSARSSGAGSAAAPATCCSSSRTGSRSRRARSPPCGSSWPGASRSCPRDATRSCGSSTSRRSSTTTSPAAGTACTTRSPRRWATSPTPARCARGPTTSSSTARRSGAGRSVSTAPTSSGRSSGCSGSPSRRPASASASCSRRCATARRRTAASRSASTASRR